MAWKRWLGSTVLAGGIFFLTKSWLFPPKIRELVYDEKPQTAAVIPSLDGPALSRQEILASLAISPSAGFPASVPWAASYKIGQAGLFPLDMILHYQPLLFYQLCLDQYDRTVQSYTTTFVKQETVKGKKHQPERIKVSFRERPFSVFFNWEEGAGLAKKVLYVQGENNDHMRVRPSGIGGFLTLSRPVDGPEAKGAGRYTIKEFGLKQALQRTLASMENAQRRGSLFVRYEGTVKVDKLRDRVCHKFVRSPYEPMEEEGLNELVIYIDVENGLQIGSVLRNAQGTDLAEYFFDDLQINPEFKTDLFTPKSL